MGITSLESASGSIAALKSSASVLSLGTAKSSVSRLSKRSDHTSDAIAISHATSQAVHAAKAILESGGSELTALKTAKAAALSALMPDSSENDTISGIGTSFLRRRKIKRQAEVVASMALASAMANSGNSQVVGKNVVAKLEQTPSKLSLQGLKRLKGSTSTETASSQESASEGNYFTHPKFGKASAADMISQQLRNFSNSVGSGASGEGSVGSTNTQNIPESKVVLPSPSNLRPRNRNRQFQANCKVFPGNRGCFQQAFVDESVDTSNYTYSGDTVDSMLMSIANVLSCGPKRPSVVSFPRFDEEEITFDGYDEDYERSFRDQEESRANPTSFDYAYDTNKYARAQSNSHSLEPTRSVRSNDESHNPSDIETACGKSQDSNETRKSARSTERKTPPVVTTSTSDAIELTATVSSESKNDGSAFEDTLGDPSQDEDAKYVQIVAPQKRNRRLARCYDKFQTPVHRNSSSSFKPSTDPFKKIGLLRKWKK